MFVKLGLESNVLKLTLDDDYGVFHNQKYDLDDDKEDKLLHHSKKCMKLVRFVFLLDSSAVNHISLNQIIQLIRHSSVTD